MAARTGSAEWRGDLKGGAGTLSVGDGVFEGNYSFASRFEEGEGTNPEELIAAAHAACYSMALSGILAGEGHAPDAVGTTARVHLRNVESDRYARLSFEVEVATEEDKNKFTLLMPRVRDGFLLYLSDRTLEELRGGEAIARTKKALEERLPELAPGVKIHALYVTDLVIQ